MCHVYVNAQALIFSQKKRALFITILIAAFNWDATQGNKKKSCSTQLSTKFQLLIKTKIPTN